MWVWATTFSKSTLVNSQPHENFISDFKDFEDRILIFPAARLLRLQSSLTPGLYFWFWVFG